MATKTNDDIYDILSQLVDVLTQNNNSNNGNKGSKPHVRAIGNERIFTTLSKEIKEFATTVEEFQRIQKRYENQVTNNSNPNAQYEQQMNKFIADLGKLNDAMNDGSEKFDNSRDYIESYHKELMKQNAIEQDIATKKFNLAALEEQLITEDLKVEQAGLEARKKTIQEEIKQRKDTNKYLLDSGVQLAKSLESVSKGIDDKYEARAKYKGTNKNGKKTSRAEWASLFSQKAAALEKMFKTESVGRIIGHGAAAISKTAAGAAKTIQSGKLDVSSVADKVSDTFSKMGPYGQAAAGLIQVLKTAFEMYAKVDKAASDYARSVGGGRVAQDKMRQSAAESAAEMSKWGQTAYLADEVLQRMAEASERIGRNLEGLSTDDLRSLKNLKDFGIDDETIAQFDTFGISVHNVSKQITDLYGESGKKGLNAKATIKAFTSNLKMAQNYTFARGQKALMDMAMKSAQLKFNLRDAEQFANKVSTLEGAMTAGAQLSVLGGNFAMQGNPLAMLYNGLNDVEGLQEQMLAMTKGMARWDSKKGQLDISAFDRERLKAMGQATGIDYSELTTMAMNQARVDRVTSQLGGGFSKDEEEYIKNLASLDENGNAYIKVGKETYSMDDIRNNKDDVRTKLQSESEAKDTKEGADLGDVWSSTRSIQDKLDDYIKWMQTKFMNVIVKIAAEMTGKDEYALQYGLEGKDLKRYNKVKRFLDEGNLSQGELNRKIRRGAIDEDGIKMLREQGIIDENNQIIKNPSYARHSSKKTFSHGQTAKMVSEYNMMHHDEQNNQKYARGGRIKGGTAPNIDDVPILAAKGEMVMNAEATEKFGPILDSMNSNNYEHHFIGGRIGTAIKNGANMMKYTPIGLPFAAIEKLSNISSGGDTKHNIKIEFGTLELKMGDFIKSIDSNRIASILLNDAAFVDNLIKEIGIRNNIAYRKDDSSNKAITPIYLA